MKPDAEARIADLESGLRRRESQYDALNDRFRKTEEHLQSVLAERDKAITDAAVLRTNATDLQNDNIRLHAQSADLKRRLDALAAPTPIDKGQQHNSRLAAESDISSSKLDATQSTGVMVVDDSCSENDAPPNPTLPSSLGPRNLPSSPYISVHGSSKLQVEVVVPQLKRGVVNKPSQALLSKRAYEKSNADHPPHGNLRKKPRIIDDTTSINKTPVSVKSLRLITEETIVPPEMEHPLPIERHIGQYRRRNLLPNSRSIEHSSRPFSRLTSDSESDLTPLSSEAEDSSHEVEPGGPTAEQVDVVIRSKYLQGVLAFDIHLDPLTANVSRKFLSSRYGGSDRDFAVYMTKVGNKTYSALFPMDKNNPLMPSFPGAPGLMYTGRADLTERTYSRVFRPVHGSSNPALWEYLGDYELSNVGSLTSAEFQKQTKTVRKRLTGAIRNKKWDDYVRKRARIFLRKIGKVPDEKGIQAEIKNSETDINRAQAIQRALPKSKRKKGRKGATIKCLYKDKLTDDDVLDAILRGEEVVDILLMTCIGYDEEFARDITAHFKDAKTQPKNGSSKKSIIHHRQSAPVRSGSESVDLVDDNLREISEEMDDVRQGRSRRKHCHRSLADDDVEDDSSSEYVEGGW